MSLRLNIVQRLILSVAGVGLLALAINSYGISGDWVPTAQIIAALVLFLIAASTPERQTDGR